MDKAVQTKMLPFLRGNGKERRRTFLKCSIFYYAMNSEKKQEKSPKEQKEGMKTDSPVIFQRSFAKRTIYCGKRLRIKRIVSVAVRA